MLAAAPPEHGWGGAAVGCARARLLMARHRHADALVELDAVRAISAQAGWRSLLPVDWRCLEALARLGSGDAERALQLADEEIAAAERFGSPRELGRALRVRGLVAGGEAQVAAIDCLRAARSPLDLARALVDHGGALRRAGERALARAAVARGPGAGRRVRRERARRARAHRAASRRRPSAARRALWRGGPDAE